MDFAPELLLNAITGAIGGAAGWLLGARKRGAEAAKLEIANASDVIDLYRKATADMQAQVERLNEMHVKQQHEINNLRTQINGLYAKARELESENTRLRLALHNAGINYESLYGDEA